MISNFLLDITLLLLVAVFLVPFFQAAKLGAVPGFLVSGILVGPSGLGLIDNVEEIGHFAEIGVVLLLFVIGIELKPSRLWLMRRLVFGLGSFQVIVTGAIISAISYYGFETSLSAAILIGPALALSSTAFVLQLLSEQKALNTNFGRTSISILLMQDLFVVPLLALVPLLSEQTPTISKGIGIALGESLLIITVVVVVGRYFLHPILSRVALSGNSEIFTASAVLIVMGSALATEHAGLSMAMGAFLAGLLISDSAYRHQVVAEIQPFRGLLLGLFFMSMGMSLNINLLFDNPLDAVAMLLLLISIKVLALFPLGKLFGVKYPENLSVALILSQSGEFALVIFALAHQSEILSALLFQQLLLIVLLSMIATPALANFSRRLLAKQVEEKPTVHEPPEQAPIVVAGFGRVGRRVGEILTRADRQFVALDKDAALVEKQRGLGHPVFYGDVRQQEVLKAAGASEADVIVVTLNDVAATEELVASLHNKFPNKKIFARGHSFSDCKQLRKVGATGVVSENIEASLELSHMALQQVGIGNEESERLIKDFRKTYYEMIDDRENKDYKME